MASCQQELDLDSKTCSCLNSHFEGQTTVNDQCPECHKPLTLDQLSLSSFLVRSSRCRQLESSNWKCHMCLEDGIESIASNWCHDCRELFCANCSRYHKKFQREFHLSHDMRNLDGIERGEMIRAMTMDLCSLHNKEKDLYCEQCNMCFCDTCYQNHSESLGCSSQPLPVSEEALKQKSQAPTLVKEMNNLQISLRRLNESTRNKAEELNEDCNSKCQEIWQSYEEMMENAKQRTNDLCQEMRRITDKQVKRWNDLLQENEKILKQLGIWRINLQHMNSGSEEDVLCGLRSLRSKISSLVRPEGECQLRVTLSNWWQQILEQLNGEKIGTVSLMVEELPSNHLVFNHQWNLRGSNLWINSIHVSEDDHIFVCDSSSIIEFTELGEIVCKHVLNEGNKKFHPLDMCSISPDIFVVVCGSGVYGNKLIFLERRKTPPYLQIKQVLNTEKGFCSLCQMNTTLFVCDWYFQIDSFTKEGEKIETIKTGESWSKHRPLIRVDPCTGSFWGTRENHSEIFCYNQNGKKIQSLEIKENVTDFCVNELGYVFYCNREGIFSFSPKNISFKFKKESESKPTISILRNKIFVSLTIDGKYLIKIFKIPN